MPDSVLSTQPLGFQWGTINPFLFCVHHNDAYPAGNPEFGPAASLSGRNLGQDFEPIDGWRMYHGRVVPGFPQHPHRGFETVTIVRRGYIDHSDSLGAAARYGAGDVQWLTAGAGIVHAEMMPLLDPTRPNPVELFQIWLNLPKASKMVTPHFSMLWRDEIPRRQVTDSRGLVTELTLIAGNYGELAGCAPPPHSWAAHSESDVAIWTIRMQPHAHFTLPRAKYAETQRTVYFFSGSSLDLDGRHLDSNVGVTVRVDRDLELTAGDDEVEILLLQGRPIEEPVVQYGPFVMNSREDIVRAFEDYQHTHFGGWPWPSDDPVHGASPNRFAKHPDGHLDVPEIPSSTAAGTAAE